MANLLDLANRIAKFNDKIENSANQLAIEVAGLLHRTLVHETPVDTSKAISNWVVTLNDPFSLTLDAFFEGNFGSTYTQSSEVAIKQGERVLSKKKPGEPIYISNNAEYINELNDGSSKQAPAGFINSATIRAFKTAKGIGLKLKL